MINLLKEGDKSQFLDFLNTHWKKDHVFVKSELLFDYQHKSGKEYKGGTHKMPNGSTHSGKTHTKSSKPVVHFKDLSKTVKDRIKKGKK